MAIVEGAKFNPSTDKLLHTRFAIKWIHISISQFYQLMINLLDHGGRTPEDYWYYACHEIKPTT